MTASVSNCLFQDIRTGSSLERETVPYSGTDNRLVYFADNKDNVSFRSKGQPLLVNIKKESSDINTGFLLC